jgi:hypothetical protein
VRIDREQFVAWSALISVVAELVFGIASFVILDPPYWLNITVVCFFFSSMVFIAWLSWEMKHATYIGNVRVKVYEVHLEQPHAKRP